MTDIVERLRKWSVFGYGYEASCDMKEAATAIELQRNSVAHAAKLLSEQTAELERLRAALEVFACDCEGKAICLGNCMHRNARAALEGRT